jgi:NAD(P)-dependent dehydrogenase (short-subunit alcohol dehydrogenase family)
VAIRKANEFQFNFDYYQELALTDRLKSRVAIVTGAAQGMGRVIAETYATEGARVAVVDRNEAGAAAVATELCKRFPGVHGDVAIPMAIDVSDQASVRSMAETVLAKFGRIDILVNNAAVWKDLARRPYWEVPVEEWDHVFAVNTRGPFLCTVAVTPAMLRQGKGKIIFIGSATIWTAQATLTHYVSSKAALIGLMHCVARELGPHNICANMIHPGMTDTGGTSREYLEARAKLRLIPRVQEADDLAGAALFFASDESDFVTGQQLHVDGGVVLT